MRLPRLKQQLECELNQCQGFDTIAVVAHEQCRHTAVDYEAKEEQRKRDQTIAEGRRQIQQPDDGDSQEQAEVQVDQLVFGRKPVITHGIRFDEAAVQVVGFIKVKDLSVIRNVEELQEKASQFK